MLILILIASQVQVPESQQHMKQTVVQHLAPALIFFINGCTLPTKVLWENLTRWKLHIFIQTQCFLLTSAIAFGVVSITALNKTFMDPGLLNGIIILSCLPTTISFNVLMTRKSNGNTALTLTQSTIGNILGPFISTALIRVYTSTHAWYTSTLPKATGGYGETYRKVFKQLGLTLFLPLLVGQLILNTFPHSAKKVLTDWRMGKLASLALLLLIWQTYDSAFRTRAFATVPASNTIFLVFICVALFLIWMAVAIVTARVWCGKEDAISAAFTVPSKTPAMGVPLATIMFAGMSAVGASKLQVPMVVFQGVQTGCSCLASLPFRWWQRRGKAEDGEERTG
ncbi:uncharacterized protein K452DRAFT_331993 [Neofusicoccum parvum]|uniref:Uncharacterized protein K452DRAFT_331993 n=1 Tax=Neofusicoccum parvum TaxID=310453 RepID=A0ACB5S8C0_9PEZI|nr:uncharacterized protein K452DRAFT_331993 [Neofusicoccum parvum]